MTGSKQLLIHMGGQLLGELHQDPHGRLSLSYDQQWRAARNATPLSLSMPLTRAEHPHAVVDPFVRGLLPTATVSCNGGGGNSGYRRTARSRC